MCCGAQSACGYLQLPANRLEKFLHLSALGLSMCSEPLPRLVLAIHQRCLWIFQKAFDSAKSSHVFMLFWHSQVAGTVPYSPYSASPLWSHYAISTGCILSWCSFQRSIYCRCINLIVCIISRLQPTRLDISIPLAYVLCLSIRDLFFFQEVLM